MSDYFGRYADFTTVSKKAAAPLLGADSMVGGIFNIVCEMEDGKHCAWLVNQFDTRVGRFEPELSRELAILATQEMILQAVLSFVAFTEDSDEGFYWGQVALICYKKADAPMFERFVSKVSKRMSEGVRTAVDLGPDGVSHVIESNGEWLPSQTIPMPEKTKGTAILKSRRSITDNLIESGRSGNKGCFIASWVFLLALVTVAIFAIKDLFF